MRAGLYIRKRNVIPYGLLLTFLSIASISRGQTTYYVASTGSDTNDGQAVTSPFQSLSKVSGLALRPGDTVLFRRGDTFRGTLLIRQSGTLAMPIRFDAYGSGSKPVLTGSVPVINWTRVSPAIWQAPCPTCGNRVTGLYRNGLAQPLGRYPNPDAPNRGSLTVQTHAATNQLTSRQPLTTDWTGGEVVVRAHYWIIDRATITGQQTNTLTLNNPSTYTPTDGWGFFIQNHPATLDRPGEWYYDPVRQVLQLYTEQGNPNGQLFTATALDEAVRLENAAFISIQQLHITQARKTNLYALNVSNLTLSNNDITDAGEDGVLIQGVGSNLLIDQNTIVRSNNNGVNIDGYQGIIFRRNTLRMAGVIPGRGKSGDGQYTGFQSAGTTNTLIENNVIDSVGYSGISVQNSTTIRQNLITNFCVTKCDGGGIYLWNGRQLPMYDVRIQSNIIRKGIGTPGGLADDTPGGAHGIFLDDCVVGADVTDNTIADCQGFGIYLHAVSHVRLLRNTCFNNSAGQLSLYHYDAPCQPRTNFLSQNILIAKTATQPVACYVSGADDLTQFGLMAQNYYARPFRDEFTIRAVYNRTVGDDVSLSQWQAQFGQDITSKTSPVTFKEYRVKKLIGTNRVDNAANTNSGGWDSWSPYNNGQASWARTNQLPTGSLTVGFSKTSGYTDSYLLVYKGIGAVTKSKSYLVQFDVTAPANKKIVVFIRQRQAPYQDLTRRYAFMAGPTRTHVEFALTANIDETDALLTFQLGEDGQPACLSGIRLQEAIIDPVNPDGLIRLVYNPTTSDSLVVLNEPGRDVKNHYYTRQILIKPFMSLILLRDSLPPVDISLSLRADHTALSIGQITSVSLTLQNQSFSQNSTTSQVQWRCRLPANLILMDASGVSYKDSLLTGTVQQLLTDTIFVFRVRAKAPGHYALAAQVTAATYADPDSTPDSGTDDGEDDRATVTLIVSGLFATETASTARIASTALPEVPTARSLVYPNPASGEFTFIADDDALSIRLVDVLGRERLNLDTLSRGQTIRFGQLLPDAPYLLYIQYKTGERRTVKLIKQSGFSSF